MTGKRKRTRSGRSIGADQKRQKVSANQNSKNPVIKHALLAQYYPQVLSLREYLLSKLPSSSKVRHNKILSVGRRPDSKESEQKLAKYLDQTLVGVLKEYEISPQERWRQWAAFSQIADDSTSFANLSGIALYSQSEVRV